MENIRTSSLIFYCLWILPPLLLFGMGIWAKLEKFSGSPKKQDPLDFLKQGMFVLFCVGIAILLDRYFIVPKVEGYLPTWIPIEFVQLMILPTILWLAAISIGGSKANLIKKAPKTQQQNLRK